MFFFDLCICLYAAVDSYKADDDRRWLVGLIADTGMRLAEGAGLLRLAQHPAEQILRVIRLLSFGQLDQ